MLADGRRMSGLHAAQRPTQTILPLYRGQLSPVGPPRFAHPAEAQLAQVFSFFGIRWAYEPTTFALAWHANGEPSEMFTPDFYLPEHRLYVELTTMRQRLVTRKNRKARLLAEMYPNARIKLVYRRDFLRLVQTFRRAVSAPAGAEFDAVLWDAREIQARVTALAGEVVGACAGCSQPPVLLTLGRGAGRWQGEAQAALRDLGMETSLDRIELTRARRSPTFAHVSIGHLPRLPLAGRPVVLLADVVSTGMSLRYAQDWLAQRGVRVAHTCALLDRSSARLVDARIDSVAFTAPHDLLAGYGLALQPALADRPFIGTVRPVAPDGPPERYLPWL